MYTAGDLAHEFTPEFSWLVLIVLVATLIIGFFIAMANVDYRKTTVAKITNSKGESTMKETLHFWEASTAFRAFYAVLAFIAFEVVILREHGNGILQWEYNHAGPAASEAVVLFGTIIFVGIAAFGYACAAYAVFGLGTKTKLWFAEIFAQGKVEICAIERPTILELVKQAVKRKAVAKKSSVPARKRTRVATRREAAV